MSAYSEFIEPSRVSHCLGSHFISPFKNLLIVGKATQLQIFDVVLIRRRRTKTSQHKLKLIEQYNLQGEITGLKSIRTNENPHLDYLLVSTKAAKMTLIKWDHRFHNITTVSLHYYENAIQNSTFERLTTTDLIVDPNSACACMHFKSMLTFLPFYRLVDEEDEVDEEVTNNGPTNGNPKTDNENQADDLGNIFGLSFMVDAQSLDTRIGSIIDVQFLYNYSKPTLAIIYLDSPTWAGTLQKVRDNVNYIVLSLDLYNKTSTTVLKIDNLPFDIDRIIPLPSPLNGSLLLGCNEIVHIDGGGINRKVALNQYTASITSSIKNFYDQSDLNLKLENCSATPIPNDHRVLMCLSSGEFYFVNFEMDGKTIKKLYVENVSRENFQNIDISYPGEIALLDNNLLFIGNKNGNSPLIEYRYEGGADDMVDKEEHVKDEEAAGGEEDDELYEEEEYNTSSAIKSGNVVFLIQDELNNYGPVSSFTLGYYSTDKFKSSLANPNFKEISLISNSGSHKQSSLNIITPSIQPTIHSALSFSQINRMWTINNEYLVTSDDANFKSEIFQINKSYARLSAKDFVNNELTIGMHELNNGKFIVQVTPRQILVLNRKFKRIISFKDELKKRANDDIIHSTFNDEYLMVFFSTGDVVIYAINTYNESYTIINVPKILNDTIITSGYIANSHLLNAVLQDLNILINRAKGIKRKHSERDVSSLPKVLSFGPKQKTFILVTGDNRIVAFSRFHNEKCFQLNEVNKFTSHLSLGFFDINDTYPDPKVKNVVLDELGDENSKSEYLTVLTIGGEIIMYKLYYDGEDFKFIKERDLTITGAPENAYPMGTTIERRLVYFSKLSGFSAILVTGIIPYCIIKTAQSKPRIFKFTKIPANSFAPYADSKIKMGLIYLDNNKNARVCTIPNDFNYDNRLPIKKIPMTETIKSVAYHELSNTYVVSTYKEIPYECLDEEGKPIVGLDKSRPSASSYKGFIKLISPFNWSVIDQVELADNEIGMSVKSMVLDVASTTKKFKVKKEIIVAGTGRYRMEDLSANGSFRMYEIIDIIPEPGKPETNHKLKEVHQEDTRGAVTSISDVSGRILVSQGQKIIIRDLQDDGVVPVAFLDTSVFVSETKSFGNLVILGDALKSVWLVGFDAEPFRVIMLGKDLRKADVNCADFFIKDEEVYLLMADNDNVLHLLKYDPSDPASFNGQRLIQKASFNLNSAATCLRSLPKNEEIFPSFTPLFQTVGSTINGSFFVVFPINEASYRRMYILQQQLTDKEYHVCGLNPRLNRLGGQDHSTKDIDARPMLDYDLLKSFTLLNEDRKKALISKISSKNVQQDVWKDIIDFENVLRNFSK